MPVFRWIERIYTTVTRKRQIKRLRLQIEDLERDRSQIKQPSEEEIREYDQKREELERKIETLEQMSIQKQQLFVAIATLAVATAAVVASVLVGRSVVVVKSDVAEVGSRVEQVEKSVKARQFTIKVPSDGGTVGLIESARGETPFPNMNHYIVVTPLKIGVDFIEDGPASVSASGVWSGSARFGAAAVGAGEQFMVRALATKSMLSPGPLAEVPDDAMFSESITVTRTK